jgi:hypothetical protein
MYKLRRLSQAFRDVGDYLQAAAEAHRLLWMLDERVRALHEFQTIANDVAHFVHQVGLSVPSWFREFLNNVPQDFEPISVEDDGFDYQPKSPPGQPELSSTKAPDPSRLRRVYDQEENSITVPDWQTIMACPLPGSGAANGRVDPLSAFVRQVRKGSVNATPEQLRSAFRLCVQYRAIEFAAELLDRL